MNEPPPIESQGNDGWTNNLSSEKQEPWVFLQTLTFSIYCLIYLYIE